MDDLHEANADTPVTAELLRSNTRIRGWLALFMLALVVSALRSLAQAGATLSAADCYGSGILATTDVVLALVLLVVAIWTFAAFHRRRPSCSAAISPLPTQRI